MRKHVSAGIIPTWVVVLASVAAVVTLALLLTLSGSKPGGPKGKGPLLIWTAASQKTPMELAAREYERQRGVQVQLTFGASQTLLANIEISKKGDLYVPADDSYFGIARQKDLLAETFPLAHMTARVSVRQGNPKNIRTLADLRREDVKFAQANPDAAAIGMAVRRVLQKSGDWEALQGRTVVFKPNVNDVANDVKLGSVDAAFIWDAMGSQYPTLELLRLPELDSATANVGVGILRHSPQPEEARRFALWLSDKNGGLKIWREQGYEIAPKAGVSPP
jgi:molybdate transport system substrate-binding protein